MSSKNDLTPSQRVYCNIVGICYNEKTEFPADVGMRVNRVMQRIQDPIKTVIEKVYFGGLTFKIVSEVLPYDEDEVRSLVSAGFTYIRTTTELYDIIKTGGYGKSIEEIKAIHLNELDLPKNIQGYLHTAGIHNVGDLMEVTERELFEINQMHNGRRVSIVKKALEAIGVELKEDTISIETLVDTLSCMSHTDYAEKVIAICKNSIVEASNAKLSESDKGRIYKAVSRVLSGNELDILIHRLKGYSIDNIAKNLSLTESGTKALLTKALCTLRDPAVKRYILYGEDSNKYEGITLNDPVEELLLSNTTTNMLKREGYTEIKDVVNMTLNEFAHLDKFGSKRFSEVLVAIKERVR